MASFRSVSFASATWLQSWRMRSSRRRSDTGQNDTAHYSTPREKSRGILSMECLGLCFRTGAPDIRAWQGGNFDSQFLNALM